MRMQVQDESDRSVPHLHRHATYATKNVSVLQSSPLDSASHLDAP